MFKKFLKEISKNNVFLIKPIKKNNILQNPVIFWYWKITDLKAYRFEYLGKLYKQKIKLEKIRKRIKRNKNKLKDIYYSILLKEIRFVYAKIDFLKNVYDFEANKLNPNYEVSFPELDYDYYNKRFFWVTKKDIEINNKKIVIYNNNYWTISKAKLKNLLIFSEKEIPWLKYRFWAFAFMSHSAWYLNIPTKKEYTLREVITLFFHEITHFFRRYNHIRNFWIAYGFSWYMRIEEWMALYNEYFYWRKLIKWLKYNPFYEACYLVLLNDKLTEKEKQEEIYQILSKKWYDRKKSMFYYYRFNRYSSIWSNNFFLKDLVYTKGYKKIKRILKENPDDYEKIMSWKIWTNLIDENIFDNSNNFDTKKYFDNILEEIKKEFKI
jgi:hypothetical protein